VMVDVVFAALEGEARFAIIVMVVAMRVHSNPSGRQRG
jgi:hypothetical protein